MASLFFGKNVKFLRLRKQLTQEALASKLTVSRSKLNCIETGQTKSPTVEDLIRYSEYFRISIDTLLKIDISLLGELKLRELEAGNDVYMKGGNLRVVAISVDKANNENVEYVPVKAKAGYTAGYHDPEYIAGLPRYSHPNLPATGTFRIFPITGDSMLPIPSGSDITGQYVADWTTLPPATPGIVILRSAQDFLFKLLTVQADGQLYLASLNSSYAPYTIPLEDVAEIWKFHAYSTTQLPEPPGDLNIVLQELRQLGARI